MALKKYRPLSPDPYVNKIKGDTEFARLAHLNDLVNQVQTAIDAVDAEVPDQAGHAGEFLTTDGNDTSWAPIPTELPTQVPGDANKVLTASGTGTVSYQSVPTELPTQTGNGGKLLTTNGTTPSWLTVAASRIPQARYSSKQSSIFKGVIVNEVPNGAITDGVIPKTLNGAMTTAVISKVGDFDKLAVTGGNTSSFVRFDDIAYADCGARITLSVKVENLNKDGVTGTSYLGIIGYGVALTGDTGSNWNNGACIDLVSRTTGFFSYLNNNTAANTQTSSSGTLVASGDILDLELNYNVNTGFTTFRVTNRRTGEYTYGLKNNTSTNDGWVRNALSRVSRLGIMASNADYTILGIKVFAGTTNPLISFVGDTITVTYNQPYTVSLIPKLSNLLPYEFGLYAGNGAGITSMMQIQLPDALKLNPRYTFFFSQNFVYMGWFVSTNANYAYWYGLFTNIINQTIAKGSIPVLIKWPSGGAGNTFNSQWSTFVDQQVVLFPQIKVLDLSGYTFLWNDSFGLPGPTDFDKMVEGINNFLIAEGY